MLNPQIFSKPERANDPFASASGIAKAIKNRSFSAAEVIEATLQRIERNNPKYNAFTSILRIRALASAHEIDKSSAQGKSPGPLAGVPFGVKNLFDLKGLPTLAGSKINRRRLPAERDATVIERLEEAGAICVGALNMGEYAYDFTGENIHDGASCNPHDTSRMTGGSSGGSGAAVAGLLVPFALGSDTNGSIRVPSSFCGIFGLKPTYGRLSRRGVFPFVSSLDHAGPLARNVSDLALCYDAMQGPDGEDPVCSRRAREPTCEKLIEGLSGLRIAIAGGYFRTGLHAEAESALSLVTKALSTSTEVEVPEAARARAAAYIISAAEGASLHLDRLRNEPEEFDPAVRDRLLAGAMIPAPMIDRAQKFRRWFQREMLALFEQIDVLIAPATPCVAPKIGQTHFVIDGKELPVRPNIGLFTQPFSFIGFPVVAAPIPLHPLPIGIQIIAAPWREDIALRVAYALEQQGTVLASSPFNPTCLMRSFLKD